MPDVTHRYCFTEQSESYTVLILSTYNTLRGTKETGLSSLRLSNNPAGLGWVENLHF